MVARKTAKTKKKKTAKRAKKGSKPMSRSLRVYQKIAIIFVVISLILLLGVLYLSISQATIRVTPNPQVVSTTVSAEVTPNPTSTGQLTGFVVEQSFEKGREFSVPEEGGTPVEAQAHGTVTLINETGTQMDLVATTRVLSEEGILFRLDEAVSVPANGQVNTSVSADQPGLSGEIGPTQFTIPGLSPNLQSAVYAVSVESMVGGVEYVRVVTQSDLDNAVEQLGKEILEEAKLALRESVDTETFNGEKFTLEVVERVSDTEPGAEQGSFVISVETRVIGVFYEKELLREFAETDLYAAAPEGYELASVNYEGMQVEIQNVNPVEEIAGLNVYLDGRAVISPNSEILNRDQFLGAPASEVETMLEASEAIEDVSISFTPFWLKRIPTLKDHIRITIEPVE